MLSIDASQFEIQTVLAPFLCFEKYGPEQFFLTLNSKTFLPSNSADNCNRQRVC